MALLDHILALAAPLIRRLGQRKLAERLAQFALMPPTPGRVVFLGDSIIKQGQWDGWFPALPTLNRGIGGESIADVAARLGSALRAPRAVVLMVGTNDVHEARNSADIAAAAIRMKSLVSAIRKTALDAALIVNSVAPRTLHYRERIAQFNAELVQIAAAAEAQYLDLWPVMAGPDGAIRPELTTDGLHLTAQGYAVWAGALEPVLARFD